VARRFAKPKKSLLIWQKDKNLLPSGIMGHHQATITVKVGRCQVSGPSTARFGFLTSIAITAKVGGR